MQSRRRADIDDIDGRIGEQDAIVAMRRADAMLLRERLNVVAARHDGRDLGVDAIDALIGVHMQLGDEAAADQADFYFRHSNALPPALPRRLGDVTRENDRPARGGYGADRSVRPATPSARLTPTWPETDSGCSAIERCEPPTRTLAPAPSPSEASALTPT